MGAHVNSAKQAASDESRSVPLPPGAQLNTASDFDMFRFLILLAGAAAVILVLICTSFDSMDCRDGAAGQADHCRGQWGQRPVYVLLDAAKRSQEGLIIPSLQSRPGLLIPRIVSFMFDNPLYAIPGLLILLLLMEAPAIFGFIKSRISTLSADRRLYYLHAELQMRAGRSNVSCLIDSGATDCLISHRVLKEIGASPCQLVTPVPLHLADGNQSMITAILPHVQLKLSGNQIITVTLYVADIADDVILGMSFLTKYNPVVNWHTRTVEIFSKGKRVTHVASDRPITNVSSVSKLLLTRKSACKLIYKRHCPAFLVKVNSASTMTPAENADWCSDILTEFKDVFGEPQGVPPDRPDCPVIHEIPIIPGSVPPARTAYKLSPTELDELKRHVDGLLEKGFITASSSAYAAPILFVRKKDNTWRMVIDYRSLNNITSKNKYPLPDINQLFERLAGARYFSKVDLTSGYHQIAVAPPDRHKTAFITRYGLYEFNVLPFGLTSAPSTFQRAMNTLLRDLLDRGVIVYLDDILVYTKTKEEHLILLRKLFEKLRLNKFYAKLSKCSFGRSETEFLGHIISPDGIRPLQDKLASIRDWPKPATVTDLQWLLLPGTPPSSRSRCPI